MILLICEVDYLDIMNRSQVISTRFVNLSIKTQLTKSQYHIPRYTVHLYLPPICKLVFYSFNTHNNNNRSGSDYPEVINYAAIITMTVWENSIFI